ncbi:DUF2183 domain-containing protein [Marivirga sp. S37H4]|uniref:DUF2183 domain-containing protein n=1 Tax=Marivirga aurantiaca TaxID=2802615 RepID=A0A934X1P5_9BACT|nr:phosphatase domain-containing protein [Marivirga aurantiaca]MBK6266690.1 DUF2183 domain-containing protein [Marivirga aurantiaca]
MENRPDIFSEATDKKRKNLKTMLGRYLSSPIPETTVKIKLNGQNYETISDELGYFSEWLYPPKPIDPGWHPVYFSICDEEGKEQCVKQGEFLIVRSDPQFGVISDIDDTVLVSHATQMLRKIRLILTKNAKTRLPFEGVAYFYRQLAANGNPLFYVSSSEWNLYDFLADFFSIRNIPKGPFLLQEYKSGIRDLLFSGGGSHQHKIEKIERLMNLYPDLSFILIGDSGQRDPEIYQKAVDKFPGRVKAVYIRKIGKKDEFEEKTIQYFREKGVELLMMETTEEAVNHARKLRYI